MHSCSSSARALLLTVVAALLVAPFFAGANPTRTSLSARSPTNPQDVVLRSLAVSPAVPMTNAQRLARGLPPNRPRFQARSKHLLPRASSGPNPCSTVTGTISVGGIDSMPVAFLTRVANAYGEYGATALASDALMVQYTLCSSSASDPLNLVTLNGISDYTSLGGITGFANTNPNFAPGSYNYAYLGGTIQTQPNAPPTIGDNSFTAVSGLPESVESAIWRLDAAAMRLTAQWVNSDGSTPATTLVYVYSSSAFALVGDLAAFEANFGSASAVTFTFVPT